MLAIVGGDAVHRVEGLPGESGPVGLTLGLGRLRALGVTGLRVALPAPGHPLGLSGPPEFNKRALEAEEAVVCHGGALGLVPEVSSVGPAGDEHVEVVWHCLEVREAPPADVPSLGEAERELAEGLREATEVLSRLDVAASGPVAEAAIDAYRARAERGREVLAPGYPPRAVRVLELAQRIGLLISVAFENGHGGAVSASEMASRTAALRPVERTARRAGPLAACCPAAAAGRGGGIAHRRLPGAARAHPCRPGGTIARSWDGLMVGAAERGRAQWLAVMLPKVGLSAAMRLALRPVTVTGTSTGTWTSRPEATPGEPTAALSATESAKAAPDEAPAARPAAVTVRAAFLAKFMSCVPPASYVSGPAAGRALINARWLRGGTRRRRERPLRRIEAMERLQDET